MKTYNGKFSMGYILLVAVILSGCSMLGGLLGGGGGGGSGGVLPDNSSIINGLIPNGASLTDESGSSFQYQIRTSNRHLESPDGGKLYGHY